MRTPERSKNCTADKMRVDANLSGCQCTSKSKGTSLFNSAFVKESVGIADERSKHESVFEDFEKASTLLVKQNFLSCLCLKKLMLAISRVQILKSLDFKVNRVLSSFY